MQELILFTLCAFFLQAGYCLWRRRHRRSKWARYSLYLAISLSAVLALAALISGAGLTWYHHRPRPKNVTRPLFEGVTYTRDVRDTPRRVVIHVVAVDLAAPEIGFMVTPSEPIGGKHMPARTTSAFLEEFGVQVAINANFFDPFEVKDILEYTPRQGEPVNVLGNAASCGQIYSESARDDRTLYISKDNRLQFGEPAFEIYHAVAGSPLFLKDGVIADNLAETPHPRTAVALDREKKTLLLIVVDGRQPSYSEGLSLRELAEVALEYGADTALNLDGGGSSALVVERKPGKAERLNWPIHTRIPGRERPVANHLGIFAKRLSD